MFQAQTIQAELPV